MPASQPPVVCAPNSFKGTLTAAEVAAAMARGVEAAGWKADLAPVADGGDGTLEVLLLALGGEPLEAEVGDPLGRPLTARLGLVGDGETAIVEMARASGLDLVAAEERDAERAS